MCIYVHVFGTEKGSSGACHSKGWMYAFATIGLDLIMETLD